MPKIKCVCGNVISLSEIPSPYQWMTISDVEYFKFNEVIEFDVLYSKMDIMVKCNSCGRLHVFWDGIEKPQTIYSKDDFR